MHDMSKLEKCLNVTFTSKTLLLTACTHPSYLNECKDLSEDNERLEFLGDAVLGLIVTEYLYLLFPAIDEGTLSKAKAELVKKDACSKYAQQLGIDAYLLLGKGEAMLGDRGKISAYGNLFEAIIGAVFLDQGLEVAKKLVLSQLPSKEGILPLMLENPKNRLQQYTQKKLKVLPQYQSKEVDLDEGFRGYFAYVFINGEVWGEGFANSKKEAEKLAAQQALDHHEYQN